MVTSPRAARVLARSHWRGLRKLFGVQVTYRSGAVVRVDLDAVKARRGTRLVQPDNTVTTLFEDDFLFRQEDLHPIIPDRYDQIEWVDEPAGVIRFFRVAMHDERQYDPLSQFNDIWRVHAVEFNSVPIPLSDLAGVVTWDSTVITWDETDVTWDQT